MSKKTEKYFQYYEKKINRELVYGIEEAFFGDTFANIPKITLYRYYRNTNDEKPEEFHTNSYMYNVDVRKDVNKEYMEFFLKTYTERCKKVNSILNMYSKNRLNEHKKINKPTRLIETKVKRINSEIRDVVVDYKIPIHKIMVERYYTYYKNEVVFTMFCKNKNVIFKTYNNKQEDNTDSFFSLEVVCMYTNVSFF